MPTKRQIVAQLAASERRDVADAHDLTVEDRRVHAQLVGNVAASRKVDLGVVLGDYPRDRLKELCRALGLDDGGMEKSPILERLVRTTTSIATGSELPAPLAVASSQPMSTNGNGSARVFGGFSEITGFLWSVADLLPGDHKQAEYGKVILQEYA